MAITIQEALKKAAGKIEQAGALTPLLDAEVLLCHVLHRDRLYLILNKNKELTDMQWHTFQKYVEKRTAGVPVQYITRCQEFMGLDFYVEEGVLIPRPDTEILVETVIDWVQNHRPGEGTIMMADLGTGSGAITVSLAKSIDNVLIYSVDISPKALKIARKNAQKHRVLEKVRFLEGDLFQPLEAAGMQDRLDILVSNPPYIPRQEIEFLQIEVGRYEPRLALDGGEDGLDFYRRIADRAHIFVKNKGLIALECGYNQGQIIKKMLQDQGYYENVQIIKDLAGIERVVTGNIKKEK